MSGTIFYEDLVAEIPAAPIAPGPAHRPGDSTELYGRMTGISGQPAEPSVSSRKLKHQMTKRFPARLSRRRMRLSRAAVPPEPRTATRSTGKPSSRATEASGENVFVVRDGVLQTPPLYSVLDGITRATVCELARRRDIRVEERLITRDDLYVADEIFLTGTAAEVTPIREIDHRVIGSGNRGPVTKMLQDAYFDVVAGRDPDFEHHLAYI